MDARTNLLLSLSCVATTLSVGCGDDNGTEPAVEEFGGIRGSVQSAAAQSAIAGAVVSIQGMELVDTTDTQGDYEISRIPVGSHTAEAGAAGFASQTRSVTVTANDVITTDFELTPLAQNAYYVSPTGDDANAGTSESPWRTIQHGVDSALPGDTVYVRAGSYGEAVMLTVSGEEQAPITIAGLSGEDIVTTSLEFARGVAYVDIAGLDVTGFSDWGVTLNGDNHHIGLRDLDIEGGEAGVHMTYGNSGNPPAEGPVADVVLENDVVRDCLYTAIDCTPGPCDRMVLRNLEVSGAGLIGGDSFGADGIAVERGQDILVEDCYVHDNGGDGIDLNSRDTSGHVTGILVRGNRVVRNHMNGIKLWAGGRMENNSIWGQGNSAVWIGVFPGAFEIVNNTVAYNMMDPAYSGRNWSFVAAYPEVPEENPASADLDLTLSNNIFAHNSAVEGGPVGIYLGAGVNLVSEGNNLFFSQVENEILALFLGGEREFTRAEIADGSWATATGRGAGDLAENPLFVAAWPGVDLHLQAGSPAIDAGTSVGAPAVDLEGNPRPPGECDMGAYER
jgi:hypothetical protein